MNYQPHNLLMRTINQRSLLTCFAIVLSTSLATADDSAPISFNEQIRPILSENCFHCHGPDQEARAADLRLDVCDEAVDYGAITPGKPDESLIVDRIYSDDAELIMPPPESHRKLTDEQKQLLSDWIEQGANYQRHWSFEPIRGEHDATKTIDEFVDAGKLGPPTYWRSGGDVLT